MYALYVVMSMMRMRVRRIWELSRERVGVIWRILYVRFVV